MSSQLKINEPFAVVGIPWYSERSWKKMKEISADQENFHESYPMWLASADKSVVILTNRNKPFERLKIDPVSYTWWCENQSIQRDKESRRSYIQYLLQNKLKQK
jgi:hypothetical protein